MAKNRYIDFLKGIAILCVIYGHCLQYGSGADFLQQELYWDNVVMKIIYSFHMPLFIAISGYLFYFSLEKHGARNCICRRVKSLLPICVTWAFILLARDVAMGSRFNIVHMVARFGRYTLTDFWFLWAVMICTFCVSVIEGSLRNWGGVTAIAYTIIVILLFITPDLFWLNAYKFMLPFFLGGFYYAKCGRNWFENRKMGLTATLLWGVLMLFYSKNTYIYTTGITLIGKQFVTEQIAVDIYRYIVGMAGVVSVVFWTKILYRKVCDSSCKLMISMRKKIEKFGNDSLIYYILSTYLFVWLMPNVTAKFQLNYITVFAKTLIVMILCLLIKIVLSKFGKVSRYIIGK